MKTLLRQLLCYASLSLGALSAAEPTTLNFGVVPTESSINLRKDYEALRVDLERHLARPVALFMAPDYTSIIEAMRFNRVQLGLFGNLSAIDAVDRAGAEVFAQTIDKDGNPGYWPVICVPASSPIKTLADLHARRAELTFAMSDPQSTSGTLMPGYYAFTLFGINPEREFKAFRRANHEANLYSLALGQLDAATANNEALFRFEGAKPELATKVREIWRGPLIASDPLLYRADLPAELKTRIAEFFYAYGTTPENQAKIASLKWSGFRPSTNDQLRPYRLLRLIREETTLQNDTTLAPEKKARRLQEIARERAAIEAAAPSKP